MLKYGWDFIIKTDTFLHRSWLHSSMLAIKLITCQQSLVDSTEIKETPVSNKTQQATPSINTCIWISSVIQCICSCSWAWIFPLCVSTLSCFDKRKTFIQLDCCLHGLIIHQPLSGWSQSLLEKYSIFRTFFYGDQK